MSIICCVTTLTNCCSGKSKRRERRVNLSPQRGGARRSCAEGNDFHLFFTTFESDRLDFGVISDPRAAEHYATNRDGGA